MTAQRDRPIGVFDSGIGGLTVVRELIGRMPNEQILYFGDTARVPYGSKSPETVARYADEAAALLLAHGIKLLVIACNTATAHAYERLSAKLPIPVIGVIEPGARAATQATRTGRIGVIGTAGTIRSAAYDLAVRRKLPNARVYAQPCPLFVPLVEEGWFDHAATRLIAREYLAPLLDMDIDALVLGCTHYPLLAPLIGELMGAGVRIVNSGEETACEVHELLESRDLLRSGGPPPRHTFFASDAPNRFREVGRRLVGAIVGEVDHVDPAGFGRAA